MFGKLKDFIYEEPKAKETPAATAVVVAPPTVTISTTSSAPKDSQFKKVIDDALAAKALREYDYLKFISSTADLAVVVPDEKTRFVTAFLSVKSMGVTKDKLGETAKHYQSVIEEERQNFLDAAAKQLKDKVEQNEQTIVSLDADLKTKEEQIAKLQAECSAIKSERDTLAAKAQEWRTKIETTKSAFEAACNYATADIKENVDKINRYLG